MAFQDRAAGTMEIKKAANDPPQVSHFRTFTWEV